MANSPILIREQRYHQIKAVLARLRLDASARLVVLVDKDGQQIAVHGELGELDTTSLASLAAGNVAATGGMAKLIGEREFCCWWCLTTGRVWAWSSFVPGKYLRNWPRLLPTSNVNRSWQLRIIPSHSLKLPTRRLTAFFQTVKRPEAPFSRDPSPYDIY